MKGVPSGSVVKSPPSNAGGRVQSLIREAPRGAEHPVCATEPVL